ncbi:acetoin utilization AcuB family protein [Halalkalibacterium ligniniphilum]|uniref:acetoin utilization AcuB family protein n=1 Tax=Halalkalibacterium ligniniphilum TaxID=1134413 RepID=UPI0003470683|nr:acetoin utilization AcuB family protein [Halalkalibacterium ligniniphilum]
MLIEEIMSRNVITLSEGNTIQEAIETLQRHRIRHLPIINHNEDIVGIVTESDIRDASPSIFRAEEHKEDFQKPVTTIMQREVITAHPLDFVAEAAWLMYENHIGCIPITENEKLVGILTETDILHTLVELMGVHQPSSQINVRVENISGKLADVAAILKQERTNITSVLVYPDKDSAYKILAFRVQTMDPRGLISKIEYEGYEVLAPKLPGMSL